MNNNVNDSWFKEFFSGNILDRIKSVYSIVLKPENMMDIYTIASFNGKEGEALLMFSLMKSILGKSCNSRSKAILNEASMLGYKITNPDFMTDNTQSQDLSKRNLQMDTDDINRILYETELAYANAKTPEEQERILSNSLKEIANLINAVNSRNNVNGKTSTDNTIKPTQSIPNPLDILLDPNSIEIQEASASLTDIFNKLQENPDIKNDINAKEDPPQEESDQEDLYPEEES